MLHRFGIQIDCTVYSLFIALRWNTPFLTFTYRIRSKGLETLEGWREQESKLERKKAFVLCVLPRICFTESTATLRV
jgi:hypothetical protein